jgi:hypothetical protein
MSPVDIRHMVSDCHTHARGPDIEDHPWATDAMVSV